MQNIERLADAINDACKDMRLNLKSVLRDSSLPPPLTWSVALSSAYFIGCQPLAEAIIADAADLLTAADVGDAQAAAALMRMNSVYYRFRHLVEKPAYEAMRPSLRMNRMMNPATSKTQFELSALACAALAGCGRCIVAHEETLRKQEVDEAQIHDAVRIAAVVSGFAVALGIVEPSLAGTSGRE